MRFADRSCSDDLTTLLDHAEGFIKTVRTEQAAEKGAAKPIAEVYERDVFSRLDKFVLQMRRSRFPFGLGKLDQATNGGASPGELVIFGAKPKAGKSAWVVQIAQGQAESGIGAYVCSREMLNYENGFRIIAQTSAYTINHFRPGLFPEVAERIKSHARGAWRHPAISR
jgi:replicative DNA helicase